MDKKELVGELSKYTRHQHGLFRSGNGFEVREEWEECVVIRQKELLKRRSQ